MCCFSSSVERVAGTQIFARPLGERQILVYSMNIQAQEDVAMILPLPVPPGSSEDALQFINLQDYPELFGHLGRGFTDPQVARGGVSRGLVPQPARLLEVHQVGQFEASYVPTVADFGRLDPRFRLPTAVFDTLPQYRDWGFAVFKLRLSQDFPHPPPFAPPKQSWLDRLRGKVPAAPSAEKPRAAVPHEIHPMAFSFPRRHSAELFFPTVHVHDGKVHAEAEFDHTLYCQLEHRAAEPIVWLMRHNTAKNGYESMPWESSRLPISELVELRRSAGVIDAAAPLFRSEIRGQQPNQDTVLRLL